METTTDNGKTVAIIAYMTLIGWIIALIMNNGNKTLLGSFHVRQSLGIICVGVLLNILASIISIPIISYIVWAGVVVLWILGLLSAVQGEMKPVPVLGEKFQEWFKGL
ncbi:hypothetical protein Aeqsu_2796 [Aequorivita sublithincola DSM 14238]|uniref:Chloroplast import component protein (Tic20) n=1 Tax=Aequorivita sublithincola (strain DSM 14238 / LMG 21431 / ACAM 643 / 9-3) TaxID=746697 RepID=I3YZ28_AEQSU|nr:membrane protein [Aequorivita sublithincola]AFL82246.1 hypothetical protein Aeqsu_2796 [Aequorivita sublithincola DSM 14238]